MKKLFLFIGMIAFSFSLWATGELPTIIIEKKNGGEWAWLNLYNVITYTPASEDNPIARLDCSGAGFSSCRIPRANIYVPGNATINSNPSLGAMFADAINQIIEASEKNVENGIVQGSQSKKIAVTNKRSTGFDTYFVKGNWNYNAKGDGVMTITLTQSNLLQRN